MKHSKLVALLLAVVMTITSLPAGLLTAEASEAGSSDTDINVVETDVAEPAEGNVMIGLSGKYIADAQGALDRINEIRLEACQEGIENPDTGKPLTEADYVPIKWSYDLEYIARIRAAESSLTMAHMRTNGNSCFNIVGPKGDRSFGEVIAWNWSESVIPGIDQWYGEKADWVNHTEGAVTGHYTQMIDPTHLYVGIGTFCSENAIYYNTTAGEFSSYSGLDETPIGTAGDCVQLLEVASQYISGDPVIEGEISETGGEETQLSMLINVDYGREVQGLPVLRGVSWSTDDPAVAEISDSGVLNGVSCGETVIRAEAGGLQAQRTYTVPHTIVTDTAVEATCTTAGKTAGSHCSVCGAIITAGEEIPALGHSWDEGKVTQEATSQADGIMTYTCTRCGETRTETIPYTGGNSGTCGDNLTWTLDDEGTLTISGTGDMYDYGSLDSPWEDSDSIIEVKIESGVTNISRYAFSGLPSLTKVSIPGSVRSIGESAFETCESLKDVTIQEGVIDIESCAFYACQSLSNISIPTTVTNIGTLAFKETPWLAAQGEFAIVNGILIAYNGSDSDVTIPDGVKTLSEQVFTSIVSDNSDLIRNVVIPSSVERIEDSVFIGCQNLVSVTVLSRTASFGEYVFSLAGKGDGGEVQGGLDFTLYGYANSTAEAYAQEHSIHFEALDESASGTCGDNLTWTLDDEGTLTISGTGEMYDYAILGKRKSDRFSDAWVSTEIPPWMYVDGDESKEWIADRIKRIVVEEGVTCIGSGAFAYAGASEIKQEGYFESISLPDSLQSIRYRAFVSTGCDEIILPDSVNTFGDYASPFGDSNFKKIVWGEKAPLGVAVFDGANVETIVLPENLTEIPAYSFMGLTKLSSINIPDSVTSIGTWAFHACTSLCKVNLPEGLIHIGGGAFLSSGITEAVIPASVKWLGTTMTGEWDQGGAFEGCSSLEKVDLSKTSLEEISNCQFERCEKLKTVSLPKTLKVIRTQAFKSCHELETIALPEGLESIDQNAFLFCTGLKSITIPKSCSTVYTDMKYKLSTYPAFYGCSSLAEILVQKGNGTFCSIDGALYNQNGTQLIYCPEGKTEISIPASAESIGSNAFCSIAKENGNSPITKIVFLGDAPSIPESAFSKMIATAYYPANNATWTESVLQDYGGTITWVESAADVVDIADCTVRLAETSYVYDGKAKQPAVTVKDGSKTLVSGTDYKISYSNNVNAGTATVVITGTGNYTGSVEKTFTILKADQTLEVSASSSSIAVGGTAAITASGTGAITYSSSNTKVASVDEQGIITGIAAGTATITVKAAGDGNYKEASKTLSISVILLQTPVLSKVESVYGGVRVTWAAVTGAENYRVYRKTGSGSWTRIGDTTEPVYLDTTAKSSVRYVYTVRCLNKDATAFTSSFDRTGKAIIFMGSPVLGKVENVNGGVKVSWSKVTGAVKYRVFRKTAGTGWKKVADTTALNYTDKTAVSGTEYIYTVRCINKAGTGYTSGFDANGLTITYVQTPVLSKVESVYGGVRVTWAAVNGAENYRVYRKTGSGSWTKIGDTTEPVYLDTTAKSSVRYVYTVRCLNKDATAFTSSFDRTGKAIIFIASPVLGKAENVNGGVKISWSKVTRAVKYRVFRRSAGTGWKKIADTTALTYTDTTAVSGTEYTYTVRCINRGGTGYTSGFDANGLTITYLQTPVLLRVENIYGGVKVTWAEVPGAENYRVYRKTGSGSWTRIGDTTKTVYTDAAVVSGTKYTYTIRCLNKDATAFTSSFNRTGKGVTYIAAPALNDPKIVSGGIQISWGKVPGAVRYRVFRKTADSNWIRLANTTALTYTDKTALSGIEYRYTVRCISSDGKVYTSNYDVLGKTVVAGSAYSRDQYTKVIFDDSYGQQRIFCYHIPEIVLLDGTKAAANEQIRQDMMAILEEGVFPYEGKSEPMTASMLYQWGISGDTLSVVIQTSMQYYWFDYYVYNISLTTGQLVDSKALLAQNGYTEDSFYEAAGGVMTRYMDEYVRNFGMGDEYFNEIRTKTLTESNIKASVPFIKPDGSIGFVANIYSAAGADHYYHLMNLEGEMESDRLECGIDHTEGY